MLQLNHVHHHNLPVPKGVVVCNIPVTMDYDGEVIDDLYSRYAACKEKKEKKVLKDQYNEQVIAYNRRAKYTAYKLIH